MSADPTDDRLSQQLQSMESELLLEAKDPSSVRRALDVLRRVSQSLKDYGQALVFFREELEAERAKCESMPERQMAGGDEIYRISAIRGMLQDAFTSKDLLRFCQDRPLFRPVTSHFGPGLSLETWLMPSSTTVGRGCCFPSC